jgi:hypothetical protein
MTVILREERKNNERVCGPAFLQETKFFIGFANCDSFQLGCLINSKRQCRNKVEIKYFPKSYNYCAFAITWTNTQTDKSTAWTMFHITYGKAPTEAGTITTLSATTVLG